MIDTDYHILEGGIVLKWGEKGKEIMEEDQPCGQGWSIED